MSELFSPVPGWRRMARPAVHLAREAPLWPGLFRRGRGRRLIALPARAREDGAARLRIWETATALEARGWTTLVVPPGVPLTGRQRLIRAFGPDVALMQGVRHPLNRPALYPGVPVAMDMDDADFHLPHLAGPLARAMPDVDLLIAGSGYVADWGRAQGAARAEVVWTGAPVSAGPWSDPGTRPAVVAWAQTRPMTYTREADLVRRVMAGVVRRRPGVTLRLYDRQPGDDPAFSASFETPGLTVEWCKTACFRDYLASFDDVAVGLAPLSPEMPFSRGKSFGKVLAYLDRKVPVVGSDAGEHGAFFTGETGVITNDPACWVEAILRLLDDAPARRSMAEAAHGAFRARLSTAAAAARVDRALTRLIADDAARRAG